MQRNCNLGQQKPGVKVKTPKKKENQNDWYGWCSWLVVGWVVGGWLLHCFWLVVGCVVFRPPPQIEMVRYQELRRQWGVDVSALVKSGSPFVSRIPEKRSANVREKRRKQKLSPEMKLDSLKFWMLDEYQHKIEHDYIATDPIVPLIHCSDLEVLGQGWKKSYLSADSRSGQQYHHSLFSFISGVNQLILKQKHIETPSINKNIYMDTPKGRSHIPPNGKQSKATTQKCRFC